ncbi:MAG: SsrA-binding protein SmpB [Bacteroidales bacterium]|nr:SsrA-binding protein SmpB [Bacteroidales bacterium]
MATKNTPQQEKNQIEIRNKRATFEYFLLDEYTAGLVLTGTEIKSIRDGKANLADAYCVFIGNELFVREMHISEYRFGSYLNHPAKRDRKLLLNRKELRKLQNRIKERGLTIVPVMLFVNPNGLAKLQIALARGKKFYDKRDSIKAKDAKRDMERQMR